MLSVTFRRVEEQAHRKCAAPKIMPTRRRSPRNEPNVRAVLGVVYGDRGDRVAAHPALDLDLDLQHLLGHVPDLDLLGGLLL